MALIDSFVAEKNIDLSFPAVVITGRDTRKSGKYLLDLAIESCKIMHAEVINLEEVTTPLLHHVVRQYNDPASQYKGVDGYYRMLGEAFAQTIKGFEAEARARDALHVDCANGAGQLIVGRLQEAVGDLLKIEVGVKCGCHLGVQHGPREAERGRGLQLSVSQQAGAQRLHARDGGGQAVLLAGRRRGPAAVLARGPEDAGAGHHGR